MVNFYSDYIKCGTNKTVPATLQHVAGTYLKQSLRGRGCGWGVRLQQMLEIAEYFQKVGLSHSVVKQGCI